MTPLQSKVERYEDAIKNCFLLARRMLHRSKGCEPEWSHIDRWCKAADVDGSLCETSVLRKAKS